MTDQPPPSTEPPASGSSVHSSNSHSHSHRSLTHSHTHPRSHPRSHNQLRFRAAHSHLSSSKRSTIDTKQHLDNDHDDTSLQNRQVDAAPVPLLTTVLVQTITLVQVVDPTGRLLRTETHYAAPNTEVLDLVSGATVAISAPGLSVAATPGVDPAVSDIISPSPFLGPPVASPATPSFSSSISTSTGSASFLAAVPPQNATISSTPSVNSTASFLTAAKFTGSSDSSLSFASSSSSWTYYSYPTLQTDSPSVTGIPGGAFGDVTGGDAPSTDTSNSEGGGLNLSTREQQIVGGVVGSVAGAAFLFLMVMLALKYKRRRNDVQELIGEGGTISSRSPSAASGGDGGSTGAMVQRSSLFTVPATLAALTSKRKLPASPPLPEKSGESGFVRVSGRKLPSVLQHGGDGYSDPRESVNTTATPDYFRSSQAVDTSKTGGLTWLALGSPMRPVSGIPIMRSGPARTAVTEQNPWVEDQNPFKEGEDPFADPPASLPSPRRDALGRTLASQDGSRASGMSGSKFHEEI